MSSKSASRKRSGPGAASYPPSSPRVGRRTMSFGGPVASFLFTFLVLSCVIAPCRAQTSKIFQWQFSGTVSTSLPSCKSFPITVKPFDPANDTHGVPPFYMMTFPVQAPGTNSTPGTPSTTLIGTDESSLSYTVNQPVGATLLMYVVDSQGSSGGVPTRLYTVTEGQSTQCIPAASTAPAFTVTANVTDTINTCQPWGLTIVGGTPPYNLTLAALNSPIVTNVTLGPTDDAFTFIDRADPNTQLIAAISDLNGRWATGTPIVNTAGSKDVSCVGLVSSSGNSTVIKEQAEAALATSKSRHKSAVAAGMVVSLLVVFLLAGVGVYLYLRRRKVLRTAEKVSPRQFEGGVGGAPETIEHSTHVLSINSFINPPSPPRSPKSPVNSSFSPSNTSATTAPFDQRRFVNAPAHDALSVSGSSVQSGTGTGSGGLSVRNPHPHRPAGFSRFPTASVRRSAKEIEAGLHTAVSDDSEYYDGASAALGSARPAVERSMSASPASVGGARVPLPSRSASVGAGTAGAQEIIYQHQDAGIVRELPPPYIDRGQS